MELLALLVGWIVFSCVFAAVVPAVLTGLGDFLEFLFLCLIEAVAFLFRAVLWPLLKGLIWLLWQGARGLRAALLILFYLADEWRRGPQTESPAGEECEDAAVDLYARAAIRLGLPLTFTAADLQRAYREAIREAHPDAGGSLEEAQIINAARDLIAQAHGWK